MSPKEATTWNEEERSRRWLELQADAPAVHRHINQTTEGEDIGSGGAGHMQEYHVPGMAQFAESSIMANSDLLGRVQSTRLALFWAG